MGQSEMRKIPTNGQVKSSSPVKAIICIPAYKEDSLLPLLNSLAPSIQPYERAIKCQILINAPENASKEVKQINSLCYEEAIAVVRNNGWENQFEIKLNQDLPERKAGVGLARKLTMDEAYDSFESHNCPNGLIVCLDADCRVSDNYGERLLAMYESSDCDAWSIRFEHPLAGELEGWHYEGIIRYEAFLRYYINMQRLIHLPFAFQTVGSAMAVRAVSYKALGGMNQRKAGEDFYFLQKFIQNRKIEEEHQALVIPAPRVSDRVPFGTGKAIGDFGEDPSTISAYNPTSFELLGDFIQHIPYTYGMHEREIESLLACFDDPVHEWFAQWGFAVKLLEMQQHCTNVERYMERFFRQFDSFQLMKYLHWARDHHLPNLNLEAGMQYLFNRISLKLPSSLHDQLQEIRRYDARRSYSKNEAYEALTRAGRHFVT